MSICRTAWISLIGCLISAFSPNVSPAGPRLILPEKGCVRFFHYWAEYGEKSSRPGGLERVHFELRPQWLYVSQGRPEPDTFCCETDSSLNHDIVPLLATLSPEEWSGQMEQDALYALSDKKKASLCRWHISAFFEPENPGDAPLHFSLYGADDGTNPKRLAAEQAFMAFFRPRIDTLKAATPRRLTNLLWTEKEASYLLDTEGGILTLERRKGLERTRMAVRPDIAPELDSIVRSTGLESFHGFLKRARKGEDNFYLKIAFDTQQYIEIAGSSQADGMPEGFREALAPLLKALDQALEPPGITMTLPQTALKSLQLREYGMIIGEDIRLYERMDKNGPVLILSRTVGDSNTRQALLDAATAAELENLLEKYGVRSWNGFKGHPLMHVLDGKGFTLHIAFRDGSEVSAKGENAFPHDYEAFHRALRQFADRVLVQQGGPH